MYFMHILAVSCLWMYVLFVSWLDVILCLCDCVHICRPENNVKYLFIPFTIFKTQSLLRTVFVFSENIFSLCRLWILIYLNFLIWIHSCSIFNHLCLLHTPLMSFSKASLCVCTKLVVLSTSWFSFVFCLCSLRSKGSINIWITESCFYKSFRNLNSRPHSSVLSTLSIFLTKTP